VTTAWDGQDALEKVDRQRPDMVVLDVMMPRIDGFRSAAAPEGRPEHRGDPGPDADCQWRRMRISSMVCGSGADFYLDENRSTPLGAAHVGEEDL